jgi:hypothetical protein
VGPTPAWLEEGAEPSRSRGNRLLHTELWANAGKIQHVPLCVMETHRMASPFATCITHEKGEAPVAREWCFRGLSSILVRSMTSSLPRHERLGSTVEVDLQLNFPADWPKTSQYEEGC